MAVAGLREADFQRLNEVVSRLYQLRRLEAFRKEVPPLLASIVCCDTCSYNEVDLVKGHNEWFTYPQGFKFPGYQDAFDLHIHEHPILRHYTRLRQTAFSRKSDLLGLVTKISDVVSRGQFQRLGIYNEYYRRLGIEHQIAVSLTAFASHGLAGCGYAFNRSSADFSERDRLCLNLLRPHLVEAYYLAAAAEWHEPESPAEAGALGQLEKGVVVLGPQRRIKYMSPSARKQLARFFGEASLKNSQLPELIARWVRDQEAPANGDSLSSVRKPLVLGQGEELLFVRLLSGSDPSLLLWQSGARKRNHAHAAALGISPREAEVLAWVSQGKSNADIASILSLSVRTIEKHMERIFEKLGVESRTAAALSFERFARSTRDFSRRSSMSPNLGTRAPEDHAKNG